MMIVDPGTTIASGTTVTADDIAVGVASGVDGSILVQGTSAAVVATNGMTIGVLGQGTLSIQNGGSVTVTAGGIDIGAGSDINGAGTVIVSGGGLPPEISFLNLGSLAGGVTVGDTNNGTLFVEAFSTVDLDGSLGLTIGARTGGSGFVDVEGMPTTGNPFGVLNVGTSGIIVGAAGTGTLRVDPFGGIALNGTGGIVIGQSSGAVGSIVVDSSTITEGAATAGITVGAAPNASATLSLSYNGGPNAGNATVTLAGGGLSIGAGGIGSDGTVTVGERSSFNTTGTAGIVVGATGHGTLTVDGTGVNGPVFATITDANGLTIGAGANSYGSVSVVGGGTVTAANLIIDADPGLTATGTLSVGPDGTLNLGGMTVNSGGVVAMSETLEGSLLLTAVLNVATTTSAGAVLTLNAGAQLGGTGFVHIGSNDTGALVNNGLITASGGTLELSAGAGAMTIASGAALELVSGVSPSASIGFSAGAPENLIINGGLSASNAFAVNNWQTNDRLVFGNGEVATGAVLSGTTLSVNVAGAFTGVYRFDNVNLAAGVSTTFQTGTDPTSGDSFVQPACFAEGTRIRTRDGLVPVELLREGMKVRIAGVHSAEPIVWIGRREVDCQAHPKPETVWPVRIRAGAFGPGKPLRDLLLSPDHAVFVGGVLVPAGLLVNGTSIDRRQVDHVTYFHVELRSHEVILAEDLPVESYLGTEDRAGFARVGERIGPRTGLPDHSRTADQWESFGAAPLVMSGPMLAAARRTVADWLGSRPAG